MDSKPEPAADEPATPETQEERALRALQAILAGGDLTAETTSLANEFTDRQSGRLRRFLRRGRRQSGPGDDADPQH